MDKRDLIIGLLMLVIIVGGCYFAGDYFKKQQRQQEQEQNKLIEEKENNLLQEGFTNALIQVFNFATTCKPLPLVVNNQTLNIIAMECFQQENANS